MNRQSLILALCLLSASTAFTPVAFAPSTRSEISVGSSWQGTKRKRTIARLHSILDPTSSSEVPTILPVHDDDLVVRAPLKYIGPYPCLSLRFPKLATSRQRERNATGISLDFVLDTAANVNTIQQDVARELRLNAVGRALPGVGAAGPLASADTYLLGDAELDGLPPFPFMTELTASALPVASPAAAGLLGLAFLQVFEGGVEFRWKGTAEEPPAITFIGDKSRDDVILKDKTRITMDRIPVTQLPSVTVTINGVEMPALLDTGSPITVLNAQAAKKAGIKTIVPENKTSSNPLAVFGSRFQEAKAAARGDVLIVAGGNGERISLIKSEKPASISMTGSSSKVDFGSVPLYVGDLPGLAALNGIGVSSTPAVVLGMDALRQKPSMLLRAQDNEIWF